jgi:hypothetical protein
MKTLLLSAFILLGACVIAEARDVVPAEQRYAPFSGDLPACDDPSVLSRIADRFEQKEAGYWYSTLQLGPFDRVRQIGFRSNGLDYIPRRYCIARTQTNDLKHRAVIYAIGDKLGMIGWGYGVEWCVVGLDRNLAYAPGCSAVRPFVESNLAVEVLRERY